MSAILWFTYAGQDVEHAAMPESRRTVCGKRRPELGEAATYAGTRRCVKCIAKLGDHR